MYGIPALSPFSRNISVEDAKKINLAERIGLRDNPFSSFGDRAILYWPAQSHRRYWERPFTDVEDTMEGSMVRKLMGIRERFTSPRMGETTHLLGSTFTARKSCSRGAWQGQATLSVTISHPYPPTTTSTDGANGATNGTGRIWSK